MIDPVQDYFDRSADDFDAIYGGKGQLGQWFDQHFRRDMYERYRLTFESCGDVDGKTVLDIGCGGGRYAIEFAKRGAAQVVGLDFAPNMVERAKEHAETHNVQDRTQFLVDDFMKSELSQRFDICLAIGVFDYIESPRPFLMRMRSATRAQLIMSFPSRSLLRMPIRRLRYRFKRCPVYFYDHEAIDGLVHDLGNPEIIKIPGQGMDYFVNVRLI
jgi:2-polyprenyl-3-methyl-5-hydroxy-6-metoxy-1,4-benzoquinol methylase